MASASDPGLCGTCAHAHVVRTARGTRFWNCRHPELPKYPRLPVLRCDGFRGGFR